MNGENCSTHFAGTPAHASGLSPGAQGNIVLFCPDSGLSGGNTSGDFPFTVSMPQPHASDFTLFEDSVPQQGYGRNQSQSLFVKYD